MYDLPHPLDILSLQLPKEEFKRLIGKKIVSYWETKLRAEASALPSLKYFRPEFMTLKSSHPIWWTAKSSPVKVRKASVQALMLSGRYRTEALVRHWSNNGNGMCLLSPECSDQYEDIDHILQQCPALDETRAYLANYTEKFLTKLDPQISEIIKDLCKPSSPYFCQFLLDCSSIPTVVTLVQSVGSSCLSSMFEVARTWVFAIHRDRLRRLDRWMPGQ